MVLSLIVPCLGVRLTVVVLIQADLQVEQTRQHFYELCLEYVCKLQEIQERKKFEFVEPVSSRANLLWIPVNSVVSDRARPVAWIGWIPVNSDVRYRTRPVPWSR